MLESNNIFINTAMDYALTMYSRSKNRPYSALYNSFLVVVVRALCEIYGEADIINPFLTKNETGLSGFDMNIKRFGYPQEKLELFKSHMQNYYEWAEEASKSSVITTKSIDFILVQEDLIDMMICKMKKLDVAEESFRAFCNLLYTDDNPDAKFKLFSLQAAHDQQRVKEYLNNELFKKDNVYTFEMIKENVLEPKFYQLLGYQLSDITDMTQERLDSVNAEVFNILKVDANVGLDNERLTAALENFLREKDKKPITSGSGFVDALLLASVLTTCSAIAYIASIFLAR